MHVFYRHIFSYFSFWQYDRLDCLPLRLFFQLSSFIRQNFCYQEEKPIRLCTFIELNFSTPEIKQKTSQNSEYRPRPKSV